MAERFSLIRREPSFLQEMRDRLRGPTVSLFDWPLYFWREPLTVDGAYLAPMEVFDRDGKTVVKLELPGIEMEDIDISLTGGLLTIKGEKKHEEEIKEENYYCSERSYGSFRRTISIPQGIDEGKISATYNGGVLEVELPKVESEKKERRVKVSAKKTKTAKASEKRQ